MVPARHGLVCFLRESSGATAIENALLMGAIGAAALVTFNYFSDDVKAAFMGTGAAIEAAGASTAGPGSRPDDPGRAARD